MSRQNIYDDEAFFEGYARMRNDGTGYNDLLERPAVDALLPDPEGLDVVDLGCGTGDRAAIFIDAGARRVWAVDPSERMLAGVARHPRIRVVQAFAEDVDLPDRSVDLVVASLSLHYVADLGTVVGRVGRWLRPGGAFVASMEHPIVTAEHRPCDDCGGRRVSGYSDEGPRSTSWFVEGVVKHHRTLATIITAVIEAGMVLTAVGEPAADEDAVREQPNLAHTRDWPPLLVLAASAPDAAALS